VQYEYIVTEISTRSARK